MICFLYFIERTFSFFFFKAYLPGSQERRDIEAALKKVAATCEEVPIIIGGQEFKTNDVRHQVMVSSNSYIFSTAVAVCLSKSSFLTPSFFLKILFAIPFFSPTLTFHSLDVCHSGELALSFFLNVCYELFITH